LAEIIPAQTLIRKKAARPPAGRLMPLNLLMQELPAA